MKRYDWITPIGVIAGVLLVGLAIFWNSGRDGFASFFHLPSLLIVLGGVFAALLVTFPASSLKRFGSVSLQSFRRSPDQIHEIVSLFVKLSEIARRDGLLALEKEMVGIKDPFIKKGIYLAIDGVEGDTMVDILQAELQSLEERHKVNRRMLEKAGDYAPAWGMIGTLIGLVLMLQDLNDPAAIGPNMAIALLTTFYGVLLANLVFNPMAGRLAQKTEKEIFQKQMIIDGVIGVHHGQNPRVLEEQLSVYLSEQDRAKGEIQAEKANG
ncbi:MotA/TolQ/ExbB proton channel family protein [Jeotgalibacillus sp. R-1-5s-1]|uniref:MotA/TolQ/ExbB proton channel family protein n=1 Tax=Jeotgalibacillus sp. R-1-5s-1 TaxID=2555897 RepID=UPI0010693C2D|nr:MotA/TolQ/ExbB proton channel family protein [Jeotgalibacillus sp. R-1-5s-1]TFD98233.1 motility protein A [Jeotgalibacillus sp. R-1-5s-1]